MFILPMIIAILSVSGSTPYPEAFSAHCSHGEEVRADAAPGRSHQLQKQKNGTSYSVDIRREGGRFVVWSLGPDYQIGMANGGEWKLGVLRQQPGDLVMSLQTSTRGAYIAIYHLRYKGTSGVLTVARTNFYGSGPDDASSLAVMTCTIREGGERK
jgi:hypothetical protein